MQDLCWACRISHSSQCRIEGTSAHEWRERERGVVRQRRGERAFRRRRGALRPDLRPRRVRTRHASQGCTIHNIYFCIIFVLCISIVLYKIQEPEIRIISYCFYGHLTQLRTYVSLRRVPLSDRAVRAGRRQIATVVQLYSSELYCE